MQLKRADNLLEIRNTLIAGHLVGDDQLRTFYRQELQELRGIDFVKRFTRDLREDSSAKPRRCFHRFLSGHPGVGKSTEFSRLERTVTGEFEIIRLNAQLELNPAQFDPRDLIVVLMKACIERTSRHLGSKKGPAAAVAAVEGALEWMGKTVVTQKRTKTKSVGGKAGAGPGAESWWAKALGLFAGVQGEARYQTDYETAHVAYRLKPVADFLARANSVFAACEKACGKQFLILVDNFEKPDFDSGSIRKLFVQNSALLADLELHYVFTMPIERANTEEIRRVQLYDNSIEVIPDAPVFDATYQPHIAGRNALRAVLESRVEPKLFAADQIERLIVASGGNIRDLFTLVISARDHALNTNEQAKRLEPDHVTPAIANLRANYQRKLYGNEEDAEGKATYAERLRFLTDFYFLKPEADRGIVYYSLLRARALQECSDNRPGVHPLVIDLLYASGLLAGAPNDPVTQRPFGCTT